MAANNSDRDLGLAVEQGAIDPAGSTEELGEVARNTDYYLARLIASLITQSEPLRSRLASLLITDGPLTAHFTTIVQQTARPVRNEIVYDYRVNDDEAIIGDVPATRRTPWVIIGAIVGAVLGMVFNMLVDADNPALYARLDGFDQLIRAGVDGWPVMIAVVVAFTFAGMIIAEKFWDWFGPKHRDVIVGIRPRPRAATPNAERP